MVIGTAETALFGIFYQRRNVFAPWIGEEGMWWSLKYNLCLLGRNLEWKQTEIGMEHLLSSVLKMSCKICSIKRDSCVTKPWNKPDDASSELLFFVVFIVFLLSFWSSHQFWISDVGSLHRCLQNILPTSNHSSFNCVCVLVIIILLVVKMHSV